MNCVRGVRQFGITRLLQWQVPVLPIAGTLVLVAAVLITSVLLPDDTVSAQQSTGQDLTLHSDNGAPRGIWSDGSTMWVADFTDRKLYAYSLSDSSRLDDRDINLGGSNFNPLGLWSDQTTIWVLNANDDKIYGYTLANGSRDMTKDIRLDGDNDIPVDIWSDGTTMYVVDQNDRKLYAYSLSSGERQTGKDLTIGFNRPRPVGVWSNGNSFWISYDDHASYRKDDDYRIYAFRLKDGAREEESDVHITNDLNSRSLATWSDGTTIWVTDKFYKKISAYQLPQPTPSSDATLGDLSLSPGTLTPAFASTTTSYTASVAYEATKLTVNATTSDRSAGVMFLDNNDSELSDTDLSEPGHQVTLAVNENSIRIKVTAEDEEAVQTYLVTVTRARPEVSIRSHLEEVTEGDPIDLVVTREVAIPEQLDVYLSVSESESLLPSSEEGARTVTIPSEATSTVLSLATDTNDEEWEAHSTVTVTINEDVRYRVSNTASSSSVLVLDDDFPAATAALSVSPNPVSEGATTTAIITVTTHADGRPHGSGGSLALSTNSGTAQAQDLAIPDQTLLDISPDDFSTTTVDSKTRYMAKYTAAIATIDDSIVEVGEAFEMELSTTTSSREILTLAQPSAIAVSILDNDAALSSLALSDITLSPEFASHIHQYEAHVGYTIVETTVAALAGHNDSPEPVILLDGVADSDGIIPLAPSENEITVEVAAEDGTSTTTYVIDVTRARPEISISAVSAEVEEGHIVEFLVSRDAAASDALEVDVTLTESGALVPDANLGARTVTIPVGTTSGTTTVSTYPDDDLWEPHSVVTAEIRSSDSFVIQTGEGAASTQVKDNDFPEATTDIVVAPNPVSEGATVSAKLTVTTKMEEEPHGEGGTLTISAREDTAQTADYGRFRRTSFLVEPDDFVSVELSGETRYQASYTAAVAITDDSDSEQDETFHIVVTKADAPRIELPAAATSTVVIATNDSSSDPTLSQLSLSPGILSPVFSSTTTRYSVALGYGVERVTVRPVVNSDNSDVDFLDGGNNDIPDASNSEDGHQIDLEVGENTVKIEVTAEDNVTTETYTIVLTRQKPEVSISSKVAEVSESTELVFTLVRNAQVSSGLQVRVDIGESGAMVAAIEEGSRAVTIPPNSTSTFITISTEHDDEAWEHHSTVNATISSSSTYTIKQGAGRAEALVKDDDFPEASATLSVNTPRVSEGENSTLSITVTTTHDQEPHGPGGTLTLTPTGGTAMAEDYGSLSQSAFSIVPSDFGRVDIGDGRMAYRAVYSATVETTDDSVSEPDETIVFRLAKGANTGKISIENPATATLTIPANDASSDASLSGLDVSDATLSTPFAANAMRYATSVSYSMEQVTLEYSKSDSGSEITALDADDNIMDDANAAPGFQVNLAVGANVIKLRVTAEDNATVQTYIVTITRSKPTVGIRETASHVSEGGVIEFDVSRDAPVTEALDVLVGVVETSTLLADGEVGQHAITIPSGATSTPLTIDSQAENDVWQEHSSVTASIVASTTYDIEGGLGSARVQLKDDDFPEATVELVLPPGPIMEGEKLTSLLTVTTNADQQPHGDGGTLILSLTGGTAQAGDIEPPHEVEFDIAAMDFMPVDVSGAARFRASYSAAFTITDDEDAESSETLMVAISKKGADKILLPTPSTTTVTIAASDMSADATLTSLTVSEGTLSPEFASSATDYTVRVNYGTERIAVTPAASGSEAAISINTTPIHSGKSYLAELAVGTTTIEVVVTALDSVTMRTYSVVVSRARPETSISPVLPQVAEGADVDFNVSRGAAVSDPLELQVNIVETGDLVPVDSEGGKTVTVPPGAMSTILTLPTDTDDDTWEEHSRVTVTLAAGDDYLVKPGEGSAEVSVRDDDFPESIASMAVDPSSVTEGESATISVDVTTVRNEAPHADGGSLTVATANDSAFGGVDYVALTSNVGTLSFTEGDFVSFEESGQTRYRASKQINIETLEDGDQEGVEKFVITLNGVTVGPSTTSRQIFLDASSQKLEVRIEDGPDAELLSLALSEGVLVPSFGASTRSYSAEVSYGVEQVTFSATTSRDSTSVTFHDDSDMEIPDLDDMTDGHQVPLGVGENVVKIKISEPDNTILETYTVAVTRVEPVVSIATTTTSVAEGDPVVFKVIRDSASSDALLVALSVTETGEMVDDQSQGAGNRSVTIPAYATSTNLTVVTNPDDEWEEHSIVSAAITASDTYAMAADSGRADLLVTDDDFPAATATLAVAPNPVLEGRQVFANVTITTGLDQEPRRSAGPIRLALVGVSATSGQDFTPILDDRIVFAKTDFKVFGGGEQTRYTATKQIAVSTVDDDEYEGPETFNIEIMPVTDGSTTTAGQIIFDPYESRREVTIRDNDEAPTGGGGGGNDGDPPDTGSSQTTETRRSSNGGGGGSSRSSLNHDPQFEEGGEATRSIEENSPIGTRIGTRVRATDRDNNDTLTYSLRGEDRSSFTINESTGRLHTATSLDREADSRYYLTVAVSDGEGGEDTIEVTIVVTDVDEAPTVAGAQEVTHPEQTLGVLGTYTGNDPENGDIRWTLTGPDAAVFDIDAGTLVFRTPPDFEQPTDADRDNSYEVTVSASDGVHTSTLEVVVNVADLDESPSPTPTPSPRPTPAPAPTPLTVPTVTPTVRPTSTPTPVPTQPLPPPTSTATVPPMAVVTATPRPADTPTPTPIPTVTPTPMPILPDEEPPTLSAMIGPTSTPIHAPAELHTVEATSTHVPASPPTPLVALPTSTAAPDARPVLTDGGVVPAWLLLSIAFWAILATGAGVFIYMRHR